jgi:Peptidase_C39 like family
MDQSLKPGEIKRLASLELNLLNYSRALPPEALEGVRLDASTPIYDTNGELLFHRFPFNQDGAPVGYADIAANTAFGAPLLATSPSSTWDEQAVLDAAREAFLKRPSKRHRPTYDELRLVAFSYPKLAVQFLHSNEEVVMLECFSWLEVPPAAGRSDRRPLEPSNFERWSLLDELPEDRKRRSHSAFEERAELLADAVLNPAAVGLISKQLVEPLVSIIRLGLTYDLHYSGRSSDHHVCYELRGQETSVWCVGASVQMLLDFYRYNYTQSKIAQQLGLGTLANPNGLPYANVGDVVTQLQVMSSNALTAHMITNPTFADFTSEVSQNRPMISFIPGHSRTVAGFTESLLYVLRPTGFRGLLVYDPWPPNAGVITRWENFDTQTYQYAYKAQVSTI